jgi:four helix bundle protein
MPHNPQRLLVVQRADRLVIALHRLASKRARQLSETSPGLRNQLLRAAVSVSANLAEACGHHTPAKAATLVEVAIGSLNEVERMLTLLQQLDVLDDDSAGLIKEAQDVRALAYGFRRRILANPSR